VRGWGGDGTSSVGHGIDGCRDRLNVLAFGAEVTGHSNYLVRCKVNVNAVLEMVCIESSEVANTPADARKDRDHRRPPHRGPSPVGSA
jgi:hypothetical protein